MGRRPLTAADGAWAVEADSPESREPTAVGLWIRAHPWVLVVIVAVVIGATLLVQRLDPDIEHQNCHQLAKTYTSIFADVKAHPGDPNSQGARDGLRLNNRVDGELGGCPDEPSLQH